MQGHGKISSFGSKPGLLLISCVILDKLLTLSVPLLSCVQNGVNKAHFMKFL